MLSKSDKKWLSQNFVIKKDLKGFATKNDLKGLAKQKDLLTVKKDVNSLKIDVKTIKADIIDMKSKINEFASFTIQVLGSVAEWTQDIHESIVKKELPERVQKLEQIVKSS